MEEAIRQVRKAISDSGIKNKDFEVRVPDYSRPSWKGTTYHQELYFPCWTTAADHHLVLAGAATHRALFDSEPEIDKWTFSTNAVAVSGRYGIPSIGYGPGDESQAHAPNEVTRVDDLWKCAAFYAGLPYFLESNG